MICLVPHRFWKDRKSLPLIGEGTFTYEGLTFQAEFPRDDDMGRPWDEHDGHGPVREGKYYAGEPPYKAPGERILYRDRSYGLIYDWASAIRLAKAEGWGMSWDDRRAFALKHWRQPTKGEVAEHAVQRDFDYLRRWCEDQWCWVSVHVSLLDEEGEVVDDEWLGGLDSDSEDYCCKCAIELAQQIIDRLPSEAMNEGDE